MIPLADTINTPLQTPISHCYTQLQQTEKTILTVMGIALFMQAIKQGDETLIDLLNRNGEINLVALEQHNVFTDMLKQELNKSILNVRTIENLLRIHHLTLDLDHATIFEYLKKFISSNKSSKLVQLFLARKDVPFDINAYAIGQHLRKSLLKKAIFYSKVQDAEAIIHHPQFDPYAHNRPDNNVLHYAFALNEKEIARMLLQLDAFNLADKDIHGKTLLMQSAGNFDGDSVLLSLALQNPNIDINAQDDQGNSALHYAANTVTKYDKYRKTLSTLLVQQNIKLNLLNNAGKTPLTLAREKGNVYAMKLLRQAGGKDSMRPSIITRIGHFLFDSVI